MTLEEKVNNSGIWELVKPDKKVRIFFNEGNPNNEIRHIRAIVDDWIIVYKVWGKRKRRWFYHVEWIYGFYLQYEHGILTKCY